MGTREYKLLFAGALFIALALGAATVYYLFVKPSKGSHSGVEAEGFYAIYTGAVIGVYGKISNTTDSKLCIDTILLVEDVEGVKVEIHKTVKEGNVYKMIPVESLCIEPGETVELRRGPGGMHIMIMPGSAGREVLKEVVVDGYVDVKIVFDDGSEVNVRAPLKEA